MGNISIKCTYPKSFSDQMKSAYNSTWQLALQTAMQVSDDLGVSQHSRTLLFNQADPAEKRVYIDKNHYTLKSHTLGKLMIDTSPEFVSEGEATGHYFSSDKIFKSTTNRANKTSGAICIDVGGGTTDYSIWFEGKIVYDCSVYLSGGQISEVIASNARLYSLLFSDEAVKALQPVIEQPVQFSSVLNYTLKKEGQEISSRIINNVNSREIAWLRRAIAIEFGALAFFAGHIALAINKYTGQSVFKNAIRENGIRLHWGGNAAKLISWIDYGKFDEDGIASKFLNALFRNAILNPALGNDIMELKPSLVHQVQSIHHKDEAAGGSVLMEKMADEIKSSDEDHDDGTIYGEKKETKMEGLILGEPMVINGKQYAHFDLRKKTDFFDKHTSLVQSVKLEQFEEFIKVLNIIGMRYGLFPEEHQVKLSERYMISLRAEILAKFNELAGKEESQRIVQPPFITAVHQYLKEYINVPR
jgi:MreB/Mbl protein